MKNIIILVLGLFCTNLHVYSQSYLIQGETNAKAGKFYTYKISYLASADLSQKVLLKVNNGRLFSLNGLTSYEGFNIQDVTVVWDNIDGKGVLSYWAGGVNGYINTNIYSVKDAIVSQFWYNGSLLNTNTINIPLGDSGSFTCEVGSLKYPKNSNLSIDDFQWKIPNGWKANKLYGNKITVSYDSQSGNNETIVVTPLGESGYLGKSLSIKILRASPPFDGNIKNVTIKSIKTYNHSNIYVENVTIKNGAIVTLNGYNSVRIVPGFTAELGSTVRIYNGARTRSSDEENDYIISGDDKTSLMDKSAAKIEQNYPNPAKEYTDIQCFIPDGSLNSFVHVYNMMGNLIMKIPVSVGHENIHIDTSQMVQGMYVFSLIIDGKLIDSKRMIVNK